MPSETKTLLELCQRATNLANTNSTRAVEYLAASQGHQSIGFRNLTANFLEVCQTLWPIQAGLINLPEPDSLPIDVSKELAEKVRRTIDDFNSLDLLLTRLLTYERKKGFSKFTKGLGMMDIDSQILKLSNSLSNDRDTLRMGSLAFTWILGDAHLPSQMGSAYMSLSNALKTTKDQTPASSQSPASPQSPVSSPALPRKRPSMRNMTRESSHTTIQPELGQRGIPPAQLPPLPDRKAVNVQPVFLDQSAISPPLTPLTTQPISPLKTKPSPNLVKQSRPADILLPSSLPTHGVTPSPRYIPSPQLEKQMAHTTVQDVDDSSTESSQAAMSDTTSQTTTESLSHLEDMLKSWESEQKGNAVKVQLPPTPQSGRVTNDMRRSHASSLISTPIHRNPKLLPHNRYDTAKADVVTAIKQKDYQALEQLLDKDFSADTMADLDLLNLCISNADSGSLRLLLVSGADPNRPCLNGSLPLQMATRLALPDLARILLKYGADSTASAGSQDKSAILMSIAANQVDLLSLYLTQGAVDLNRLFEDGESLFIKSITTDSSVELVSMMIEHGAEPNKKTKFGKTPLLEALFLQRLDIATVLLDAGANPNLAGPKHPLWPATHVPALLQLLLDRGATPRMAPGVMELATSMNNIEAVRILLDAKVDPNIKKDGVYTPLCSAIRDDRADIVALLLQHNADPNIPASEYPAFKCVTHNRLHYLPDLLAAGADLSSPKGILEVAVAHDNKEALLYLLSQGVDVNARNGQGHTALTTAIRMNRPELVDILLENGASPAVRGSGQSWPLTLAIQTPKILAQILPALPKDRHGGTKGIIEAAVSANQPESVRMLLAAGFSVEDKTGGVFSPLTTALRERYIDIVRLLLDEAGADVNAAGEHLPIVKALRRCRGSDDTEAIEMLLERGVDINLVYRGWSGILQVVENGDAKILRLIVNKAMMEVDLDREYEEGRTLTDFIRERDWEEGADILLGRVR